MKIGILGGTGPAGRGLGIRLAVAGHQVVLGSRDGGRAEGIAADLRQRPSSGPLDLVGRENGAATEVDLVVVATPWDSAVSTVRPLAEALAHKTVISMCVAMVKERREMVPLQMARGSVAGALQAALPESKVSAACHHLPASELEDLGSGLEADVLVCSDYDQAREDTMALISSMKGFRPVDAGSLAQAGAIEGFTAVCVTINMRNRVHSTVRMVGI